MEVVAALTTVPLLAHESDPPEHGEVLRDRGTADGDVGGKLADRLVAAWRAR